MAKASEKTTTEETKTEAKITRPRLVRCLKGNLIKDLAVGSSYTVTGQATKYETGETNFGPFRTFHGQFAMKHGNQIFTSGKLIVPEVASALIANQLDGREKDASGVEQGVFIFAINIEKVASEKSVTGYEWAASFPENIKVEIPKDPFVALLEQM